MTSSVIFWSALGLAAWTWAGYPAALCLLSPRGEPVASPPSASVTDGDLPSVTIIVPVHNAERALARKLGNCLGLDYPADRFSVVVALDGADDGSPAVARACAEKHPNVRLAESSGRTGKSGVQNLAAAGADGDILLLTDVDAVLEPGALRLIARRFRDPGVGCVTGRVVWGSTENPGRAHSDNLYWRFEHAMWEREDALGALACASGTCMAVRRSLFRPIDPRYGDDVVLPLDVLGQGARVAYEPALTVVETSAASAAAALRARARMTLRSLRGTMSRREVFSPLRRPGLFATVVSHKLLRWATPFLFLAILGSGVPLALGGQPAAWVVLALQAAWLAAAAAGHLAQRIGVRIPLVAVAYDLSLENAGMLIGVTRAMLGHHEIAFRPGGQ
jgi:cellulose synthase/poly-beta-1,6-N-acetylglucosamine synthase-like glycosyltransferase